jgi:hypothetical protein
MGIYVDPNGTMWNVVNGTEPKSKPQIVEPVWREIAVLYSSTWNAIEQAEEDYARPERMRVVEFNNSIVDGNASTFVVENDDVRALYNDSISRAEYTSRWFRTARQTTPRESYEANGIAGNTTNVTVGPDSSETSSLEHPEMIHGASPPILTPMQSPLQFQAKPAS